MKKTLLKKLILPLLFMAVCIGSAHASTGNMTIGGTSVPDLSINANGTGWTWNATTETLSLTNTYTGEAITINCQSTDEIKLDYTGNVSVSNSIGVDEDGFYCNGLLTINGSGGILSFAYTGKNYMYSAITSMQLLTISSGNVYAVGSAVGSDGANACTVYARKSFHITGDASVVINTTSARSHGIYTEINNSEISTTGTVTANATGKGYAIYIANNCNLTISNGTINLSNNDNPINMIYNKFQNGNFNMTGGIVIYNGGTPPTLSSLLPASGTYNEEVVLSGSNLTGAKNVFVNGKTTKSFTVNSDSQLTFTTPPAEAGTARILVETPEGAACMTDSYTYTSSSYRVTLTSAGNLTGYICGFIDTGANTTIAKPVDLAPITYGAYKYAFTGGWYANQGCTTEWDFNNKTVDRDMNIYAKFESLPTMTPADEAVDVAIDATVSASYLIATENDLSGITLSPDPGNVSASLTGNTITITHDNFEPNTKYTVTIPAGATNRNTLDVVWSFTTAGTGVGIENTNSENGIQIYPNTISDYFCVKGITQSTMVSVYTMHGKTVLQRNVQAEENISVGNLPAGIYLIAVDGTIFKIVKK
ncbi:T9SS C-terminal target domain-containing protein [Dysgonomonas sp. 216]|uniref:Ig-like domain-containing protein n=1 Tax=Dysgonomonas sp. 216 TaxID=2302934 RepID=UPI0013D1BB4A|nr:Ig-like domain-containing protein [Dysgonomonas sp. 216]NDW17980.1 T9SS C-terminal target domain-containing protein [Dysgonomonas sp. 216]